MSIEEDIIKYIRRDPNATFVELSEVDGFEGEFTLTYPGRADMILWDRISYPAITALDNLGRAGRIEAVVATVADYRRDGRVLDYPIARDFSVTGETQWLPVSFHITEYVNERGAGGRERIIRDDLQGIWENPQGIGVGEALLSSSLYKAVR